MDRHPPLTDSPSDHPSLLVGVQRQARRLLLIYWPLLALATHWPRMDLGPPTVIVDVGTDKLLHAACFVFLTLLLYYARLLGRRGGETSQLLLAAGAAGVYAVIDELTQAWVPGREANLSDIAGNLAGVAAVMLAHGRVWMGGSQAQGVVMWTARWLLLLTAPVMLLALIRPNSEVWPLILKFLRLPVINDVWLQQRGWVLGFGIDKVGHAAGAVVFTLVLLAARPLGRHRPVLNVVLSILVLYASGPLIEWMQDRIGQGRGFEADDIAAHSVGVTIGLAIYLLWAALRWLGRRMGRLSRTWTQTICQDRGEHAFVGHAMTVSALTMLSRVTGLARDSVIASGFGMGRVADAFYMAFQIPNLFRRLFGEGALSAAFIPQYSQLLHEQPDAARRLATLCTAVLAIVLAAITLIGEGILWALLRYAPMAADTSLLLRLAMIMLPYMPLICLVALLGGMLQVHRCFGPPAAAPIVLNLTLVVVAAWATMGLRNDDALAQAAVIVAVGVLAAGVLQLLWQIAALGRFEPFGLGIRGTGPAMRRLILTMLPMLVGLAVFQVNAFLDSVIAYGFAPSPDGSTHFLLLGREIAWPTRQGDVAALNLAQRLYQFPLGVFGVAIATAIFPALSRAAAGDERRDGPYRDTLRQGLRLTLFIGLPASVGVMLVGLPLARLIFEYRQFTLADAQRVAVVLAGYSAGIWAYSLMHVLTRAYYALQDTRTPLRIALAMMVVNLLLNVTGIWVLGVVALAWSTSITAVLQVVLLLRGLSRQVPAPVDAGVRRSWSRSAILTALMGAATGAWLLGWSPAGLGRGESASLLAAMVATGVAVYAAGSLLTGSSEVRGLLRLRASRR